MSATPFADLNALAAHLRQELQNVQDQKNSFCSTPTTALARRGFPWPSRTSASKETRADTLYFNAFTEDLFSWDNDLEERPRTGAEDSIRRPFFLRTKELEMDNRIRPFLNRYTDFDFNIDYEKSGGPLFPRSSERGGHRDQ